MNRNPSYRTHSSSHIVSLSLRLSWWKKLSHLSGQVLPFLIIILKFASVLHNRFSLNKNIMLRAATFPPEVWSLKCPISPKLKVHQRCHQVQTRDSVGSWMNREPSLQGPSLHQAAASSSSWIVSLRSSTAASTSALLVPRPTLSRMALAATSAGTPQLSRMWDGLRRDRAGTRRWGSVQVKQVHLRTWLY